MATIRFYLKNPSTKDDSLIYMFFLSGQEQFKMSTMKKIKPKDWDMEEQRPRRSYSGYSTLRGFLTTLAADAEAAYIQLQSRSELFTMDDVKAQILKNKTRVPEPKAISFSAFLELYIERSVALKSHATIKAYKNTRNHLLDFEKTLWPKKLSFESIDQLFYDDFMQFLIKKKQLSNNWIFHTS